MKKLLSFVYAVSLLLPISAKASLYDGDWGLIPVATVSDIKNANLRFASDEGSYYFRLDLGNFRLKVDEMVTLSFGSTPDWEDYSVIAFKEKVGFTGDSFPYYFTPEFEYGANYLEWKTGRLFNDDPFYLWGYIGDDAYLQDVLLTPSPAATPTPIPGAVWLLGSGLLGLIALKRRK